MGRSPAASTSGSDTTTPVGQNKFYTYESSGGIVGVTNTSGTANNTDLNTGTASIFIPDNQSDSNWFVIPGGASFGISAVAASYPASTTGRSATPRPASTPTPTPMPTVTVCQYNDSLQRNYTATPIIVLANPVNVTTQTTAGTARGFFGLGSQIALKVNVQLPGK